MTDPRTRRHFLRTLGVGSVATLGAALSAGRMFSAQTTDRPRRNILLYVVDDLGTDDGGCYGNRAIKTPGLDALAREGVRFTHAFCTSASCSASRSVILSGLHNHANGQYGHEHSYHHFRAFDHVRSLPVRLGEAGYRTVRAGKFHVGPESVYQFDRAIGGGSPEDLAEKCRPVIADESDAPFFLYFCTNEPHRPFRREGSDTFRPEDVHVPPYLPDTPECREELAEYYGSVQRMDRGLVRLMEILKETGRWEDTLVIFISDNGVAFPGAKTTLYEPGMRLPCVVRNPFAQARGAVTEAMVSFADLTPTLLDYAGVTAEENAFHGRSFLQAMEERRPEGWDEVFASHTFHEITMYYPMRVVRERRWKLIWNIAHGLEYPFASDLWESRTWQGIRRSGAERYGKRSVAAYLQRPPFELYDLEADPDEIHNRADDPACRETLDRLKARLRELQESTGDPWIMKWEYE